MPTKSRKMSRSFFKKSRKVARKSMRKSRKVARKSMRKSRKVARKSMRKSRKVARKYRMDTDPELANRQMNRAMARPLAERQLGAPSMTAEEHARHITQAIARRRREREEAAARRGTD